MPQWFYLLAMGLFGLVFGSFANVVIWRFPRDESLSVPASHCPRCSTPISWFDNIPVVSWVLLRGRCRACGEPISLRYPFVELLSCGLWASAGAAYGMSPRAAFAVFLFYLLLILAAIDLDTMRLPNVLVALVAAVGFGGVAVAELFDVQLVPLIGTGDPLGAALIGSLGTAGFSLVVAVGYSKIRGVSGFGMGDVKLLAALGPYLGLYTPGVLFVGSVIGTLSLLIPGKKSQRGRHAAIPFGPAMCIATVLIVFFGRSVLGWYLGMVGL